MRAPSGRAALRAEAVAALGRMGAVAAVPTLRVTLLGPSLPLSQAAATALSAIAPKGIEVLQEIADDHSHPAAAVARPGARPPAPWLPASARAGCPR